MIGVHAAFVGRLGAEPEQRYSPRGTPMLSFRVAVDQAERQPDREREQPQWVRVTCWGEQACELADALHKGSEVYCEGRLTLDSWTSSDGQQRSGLSLSAWTCTPMGVARKSSKQLDGGLEPREAVGQ